ncbi:LysM peptidoglycan-binding domain-containing protein [Fulvivirga sp. RKSG066]|uniref:LysM peptidoglycan-binding domain-containing protein n=1 Tax=Fulvivirga aurantia TaxID=2529383 RepID=UPI0012BC7D14|nr:LysM peptidoglycan-binding domain-containing protein [Fulvivirga aurantia]MTI20407.1 LysM peptidoglycan-binding domain-containing protein [Fulvivirga aurantia]
MRAIFFLIVIGFSSTAWAQDTPQVPSKMEFAGIKLRIHESGRKDIQESVDALTRSKTHYNVMIEKARSYFPIIERVFKEENLPEDFKYLVLQESALIPDAVSSSNAVGYWQFKDFTAMEMGLRVDKHIDERMNITAASRAAAKYLKLNNTYFDNWLHALQAYQMGAGGAMRVLKDASGVKSMTIDKKTYWYVKKFLAHKVAYEGVVEEEPTLKLSEYTNGAGKTLKDISKEVNVSEEEITAYNKWLKKGRIPEDKTYPVIIPSEQYIGKRQGERIIAKNGDTDNNSGQQIDGIQIEYTFVDRSLFPKIIKEDEGFAQVNALPGIIARGDEKVAALAAKGGISLSKFLKYNDISIDHRVRADEPYYLKKKRAKARAYYHVLQPGESLWEVSQKYGLRLSKLRFKNRIREDNPTLKAGRVLWLRYVRPAHVDIEYKEVERSPKPKIAKKETPMKNSNKSTEEVVKKVTDQDSVTLNIYPLVEPNEKEVEPIISESDGEKQSEVEKVNDDRSIRLDSVKKVHAVKPGQTYYAISKLYNVNVVDVLEWNNLKINDKLAIGQKLIVYEYTPEADGRVIEEGNDAYEPVFIYYIVKPGDTLYKIARQHEITVEELMELNEKENFDLDLGEKIKVGQKMIAE